jgi:ribose 5-phosphate isomerase B
MEDGGKVLVIGSDHGGFEMKQFLAGKLNEAGYKLIDFGTDSDESVDYPDYIHPLASAIDKGKYQRGIILCGSGNGAQITANKYPGVRAALAWNREQAELSRQHNNANIVSIPGRFVSKDEAWEIVRAYLDTPFEGGRHERRVNKIPEVIK